MKNFNPCISFVIPIYNAEEYLANCLESIVMQTFGNFEVILINDWIQDGAIPLIVNELRNLKKLY